jgi:hypothetical protein
VGLGLVMEKQKNKKKSKAKGGSGSAEKKSEQKVTLPAKGQPNKPKEEPVAATNEMNLDRLQFVAFLSCSLIFPPLVGYHQKFSR